MSDKIKSRGPTEEYRRGWDRIFGERRKTDGESLPPFGADAADAENPLEERRQVQRGKPFLVTQEILDALAKMPQPPDDDY